MALDDQNFQYVQGYSHFIICQGYPSLSILKLILAGARGSCDAQSLSSICHPLYPRRTRWMMQMGRVGVPPKHGTPRLVELNIDLFVNEAGI